MIRKSDVWLWVLIAEKQKQLKDRLGAFDDDEFDAAELFVGSKNVADNKTFLRIVADIVEGDDE